MTWRVHLREATSSVDGSIHDKEGRVMLALSRASALGALLLFGSVCAANPPWGNPLTGQPYPTAPDACGPGFYVVGPYGMVYGPNYYLVPPWAPVGTCIPTAYGQCKPGVAQPSQPLPAFSPATGKIEFPNPGPAQQKQVYPTHPFVRSPRDFFMWNESIEEQESRSARPGLVP
jgi:hypothetical protein